MQGSWIDRKSNSDSGLQKDIDFDAKQRKLRLQRDVKKAFLSQVTTDAKVFFLCPVFSFLHLYYH
jgi:hypothetical protein